MGLLIRYTSLPLCFDFKYDYTLFQIREVLPKNLFFPPQTILGDFQKEQEKFVQEKKSKQSGKH